jgi:glycosyltransferase involved in cell wall biosynthesis
MLEALLLAGIMAAPIGSALLFLPARKRTRTTGTWPAIRRFGLAVVGTILLAAAVVGALRLLRVSGHNLVAGAAGLVFASAVWLPATRRWNARAHLCWATSVYLFVVYLVFALEWTLTAHMGPASTAGGVVLWVLEVIAAVLSCAYLWEICDALGTEHWRRRITRRMIPAVPDRDLPMVSLHVPAHNEPPAMVIDTLRSLLRLDYPRYEVILIDDNTEDEWLWGPVERWCARHGVKFKHLENWPGYKSGALNYALRHMTDPNAEVIGVVDSDYQLDPGFLRRCAPGFADPWVGFVQAPQDYRGWRQARYYRRLYYSYKYYFAVSQPARNEHNGAIFAGTMGLIRRVALDELGGWDEWCITEDAEISLRLLRAGWSGLHVDETWGRGIMPLTFEALKGQRYRWCFGGIQILRMHLWSLLPGRKGRQNHLTPAQRWAYLAGGLQWYGDLLGLIFLVFLLAGAANLATGGGELFRKLTTFLLATIPVLVVLGLVRAGRTAAPRHRRNLAGRHRGVLHLAVHLAGGGPGVGAGPVRPQGRLPAHPQDQRAGEVVGSAARQLGRMHAGAAGRGGHRRRTDQVHTAQRAAAGRAAALPHPGHGSRTGQQLGRAAGCAPAMAARAAAHRAPAGPPGIRRRRRHRRCHRGG